MTFSPRSSSVGLRRAFSNLLTSRHFNNFTSLRDEVSVEYLIQNIPDGDDHNLPPKKRCSDPGNFVETKSEDAHADSYVPHKNKFDRRHFKHPLATIAPLIADHQPFHQPDDIFISDPPPSGFGNAYGNHLSTTHFASVDSPKVKLSINCSLLPLVLEPGSHQSVSLCSFRTATSSRHKSAFFEAKTQHSQANSSSPVSVRRGDFDTVISRPKSSGKHSKSLEGMDGVTIGAATCLLATRKHPKPPNGIFTVDQALLLKVKSITDEAIKKNKVFAVLGPYRHIREGMRRRGWVEKFYRAPIDISSERLLAFQSAFTQNSGSASSNSDCAVGDIDYSIIQQEDLPHSENGRHLLPWEERNGFYGLLGRNVRNVVPNFIWSLKKAHIDFRYLRPNQIVNHHVKAPFTTKVGLCRQLRHYSLYSDKNENTLFPRCYIISSEEERLRFIKEFRITASMAIVKWACNYYSIPPHFMSTALDPEAPVKQSGNKGKVAPLKDHFTPVKAVSMALLVCENFLRTKRRDEAEISARPLNFTDIQWSAFLECFYATRGHSAPFSKDDEIAKRCRRACDSLKFYCHQFELDGQRNIWIVKPGSKSRGRGISCHTNLDAILAIATNPNNSDNKFVVQKYIERPLLIYNTKFDIRQWFLIADWQPLTIWWYKECYLRFCSREFTLDNFSEDIHLSNNAITHKYKNGHRSPLLPTENMWYMEEFQQYLENLGHGHIWDRRILPGMQKAIINSMLCSQDTIDARKGCFELYGADFMISADDMRPWLIEINASPCMAPSTSVTSDLAAKVLEDTLKVIIDRRTSRNCDVGGFILLYRQKIGIPGSLQRETSQHQYPIKPDFKGTAMALSNVAQPVSMEPKSASLPSRSPDSLHSQEATGDEKTRFRANGQPRSATPDPYILSTSQRSIYSSRDVKSAPRPRNPSIKRTIHPQPRRANNQMPRFPAISPKARSRTKEREIALHGNSTVQFQKFVKPNIKQLNNTRFHRTAADANCKHAGTSQNHSTIRTN